MYMLADECISQTQEKLIAMKILILNADLGYGGAEKMLAFLAGSLADAGMDVTFLTYRDGNDSRRLSDSVKREHLELESEGGSLKEYIRTVAFLRKYVRKERFDLALAFLLPSQVRLIPACKGTGTKVLLSQRGDPYHCEDYSHGKLISRLNNYLFGKADFYVFQTEKAKKFYPEKIRRRSTVIPNPVMPVKRTCSRTPESTEKRIVSVGRLEIRQKRQDLLIEAFKKFSSEFPEYILEIYGGGEDEEKIRNLTAGNEKIKLKGVSSDIPSAIENAAMFVMTSDYEGIPNALAEAMSLGLPCISTDCSPGGAALLIENGRNGLLVPCDNPESICEAMKGLARDPATADSMGKQATKITDRFSPDIISGKWIKAIEELE